MRSRCLFFGLVALGCGQMYAQPGQSSTAPQGPPGGIDPYGGAQPFGPTPHPPGQMAPVSAPVTPPEGAAQSSVAPGLSPRDGYILTEHNRVRAKHCSPPLAWSAQLASVAQQWADSLRDQDCAFAHSAGNYGENLAAGTTGMLDPKAVVAMWYDENSAFSYLTGGFSMQTGHFTQVVWRATTQVGCGMSQCKGLDVWVCEYDPAGNVEGAYRENVLPVGCR